MVFSLGQYFPVDLNAKTALIAAISLYFLTFLDRAYLTNGRLWPSFQKAKFWKHARRFINGSVTPEKELNHDQQYIFAKFPHGAYTLSHILTMTDCCGMFSKIHKGARRDLAASVLFFIPGLREFCIWLGCVDAGARTANFNLKRGRSILIYIGGEEEQMLTQRGKHIIVLKKRKGFVKLALQHGAHLVPMYAFGETDAYYVSDFLIGFRTWLQKSFRIALPLVYGDRFLPWIPITGTSIKVEMGAPIVVEKMEKSAITSSHIDALHDQFVKEMVRLFDRTKASHGYPDAVLEIV